MGKHLKIGECFNEISEEERLSITAHLVGLSEFESISIDDGEGARDI